MNQSSRLLFLRGLPVCLLLLLLAFPALSVKGAASGLLLWFDVVLPTLTPFIICTQMVVSLGGAGLLIRPFYPAVHTVFGLSPSGTYVLLCGLLCGYPLGAKICGDFLIRGMISKSEADYLLSICNHPSPMFLLGFVRGQLPVPVSAPFLLACLYLPVLPVSLLSRRFYHRVPVRKTREITSVAACEMVPQAFSLEEVFLSTAETMVVIGGYIMLFSILVEWIGRIPCLSKAAAACLSGAAEITTGVRQICTILPPEHVLLPVMITVAFGGFSGIFQTRSVIKNAGLSVRHYLSWKLIHALCTGLVFILLSRLLPL